MLRCHILTHCMLYRSILYVPWTCTRHACYAVIKPSFCMGVQKTRRKSFSYDLPNVTDRSLVNKAKGREFWTIKVVGQETEMHFALQKTMQTSIPHVKLCMWDDVIKHHVILHIQEGGCHNFTGRNTNREPSWLVSDSGEGHQKKKIPTCFDDA